MAKKSLHKVLVQDIEQLRHDVLEGLHEPRRTLAADAIAARLERLHLVRRQYTYSEQNYL